MDCETLSVPEAAKVLGIGRVTAFRMAKSGDLPVLRCGARRIVVPKAALEKMLQGAGKSEVPDPWEVEVAAP